ncbi:MAG: hypothetical protein E6I87_05325 [Chloroflexi bacterium]|nr:MAG: hypothetical protein E6I87_05325 [Chloroflexota bacterium]
MVKIEEYWVSLAAVDAGMLTEVLKNALEDEASVALSSPFRSVQVHPAILFIVPTHVRRPAWTTLGASLADRLISICEVSCWSNRTAETTPPRAAGVFIRVEVLGRCPPVIYQTGDAELNGAGLSPAELFGRSPPVAGHASNVASLDFP